MNRLPAIGQRLRVMRLVIPLSAVIVGVALGLAVGMGLRYGARSSSAIAAAQGQAESGTSELATVSTKRRPTPPDDSPLTTQLARDLSMSTGVTRWLYWWDAIEKATPSDFPRLARLAEGNRVATRLVSERWAELAPQHFFDTLRAAAKQGARMSGELSDVLLSKWLKQDKAGAIAALNNSEVFPELIDWRRQIASSLMDVDPEMGLRMMSQWHIENYVPNMKAVGDWAAADPRHAAEFTMANPLGYASRQAMQIIGQTWAKSDPAQALQFATTQRGALGRELAQAVLKTWAERDLTQAANWLAASNPAILNEFSPAFAESWAKQDTQAALQWCVSNLAGTTLNEAVGGVFKGAAQKDVVSAAALVTSMDPSPARSQAAATVAEKWFPDTFSNKPVPSDVLIWLSALDADSIRQTVEKVSWKWSDSDPTSLASFLQSATNLNFPIEMYNNLARTMARSDPMASLAWTGGLPEQLGVSAGSAAFAEWGRSQLDAAIQWFNELPSSDPRHQPFLTSLLQQLAWDPQATERFGQVAALDPSVARSVLQGMALPADRRTTLLSHIARQARQ